MAQTRELFLLVDRFQHSFSRRQITCFIHLSFFNGYNPLSVTILSFKKLAPAAADQSRKQEATAQHVPVKHDDQGMI